MKHVLTRALAVVALGFALAFTMGSMIAPAGAQETDLCALLGDPYCPAAVGSTGAGRGTGTGTGTVASGQLARTGNDIGPLVGIGAGFVALGAAAAYGARRRSQHAGI